MEFELDGAPMAFDASPRYYANCQELATEAGFSYETLSKTMATYNQIAAKMVAGEPGAPYEAYGGGMSWDPWGKKFFHNVPVEPTDEYHVRLQKIEIPRFSF